MAAVIVAITGGRHRLLTLAELERLDAVLFGSAVVEPYRRTKHAPDEPGLGATLVRHGDCDGTDKSAAAYLRARRDVEVEPWRAEWERLGRAAGPVRNRRMLHGQWTDLDLRGPVGALVRFDGGKGTADCCDATVRMGLEPISIPAVAEPRPWNRHHGTPTVSPQSKESAPVLYCGNTTPVGNPFHVDAKGLRGRERAAKASEVLARYREWLWARINPRSPDFDQRVVEYILRLTPAHFAVCSCWPLHCHVEVVIAAWRWLTRARE